jgi:MADS-box transcription factor
VIDGDDDDVDEEEPEPVISRGHMGTKRSGDSKPKIEPGAKARQPINKSSAPVSDVRGSYSPMALELTKHIV